MRPHVSSCAGDVARCALGGVASSERGAESWLLRCPFGMDRILLVATRRRPRRSVGSVWPYEESGPACFHNAYKRSVASYLAALAPLALRGPPPPGRRTGTPALGSMRDATRAAWRCGPLHPHQERRRETQSPATARARPNPACRVARVTHAPRAAHTRTV